MSDAIAIAITLAKGIMDIVGNAAQGKVSNEEAEAQLQELYGTLKLDDSAADAALRNKYHTPA